ncbi:MAG: hypothetical protein HY362_02420 [Candidatus Aenigmarchaeota archaeon]|nr:hypothetical protein [Candidatus Aenigmarchaeota archaeon]
MKGSAKVVLFSVLAVFAIMAALAVAQTTTTQPGQAVVKEQLPLQGFLKDSTGKPVTQDLSITFNLYDVATAGTALFTETQTISVKKGTWFASLGKTKAFPNSITFDKEYYAELEIGGNKLSPRIIIAPGAFIARKNFAVADGSITTGKLADESVTNGKIKGGSIQGDRLICGAAVSNINADACGTNSAMKVKGSKIQDGTITATQIADGTITGAKLFGSTVTKDKLAADSVGALQIENNGVSTTELADNAVTSSKIGDGAVATSKLANGAVTKEKVAGGVLNSCAFCKSCGGNFPSNAGGLQIASISWRGYDEACGGSVDWKNDPGVWFLCCKA